MKTENIVDVYPMNDVQKGMVFTTLKNTGDVIYHDQFVYYVPRITNVERFEHAIRLMMEVHPILRTGFDLENYTEQLQIVYDKVDPIFNFVDLTELSEDKQEEYIKRYMQEERYRPYDFKIAPLWRIAMFNLDENNSVYLIQFHHAVLDGWSMATFNTQLFNVYSELEKNKDYKPEPLKASVKDAVVEEIAEKNNPDTIQFWKDKLSNYNKPRIFTSKVTFEEFRKFLDQEVTKKLKKKAAEDGLSYKNIVYGAFVYVLKTLSLEEDFVVGIVSNTRPIIEDGDKVLGCFLNSLPMKLSLGEYENSTWLEYFKSIEEEMRILKTKDRSTLFEISKIAGERIGDGNPFFDILFNHIDFYNVYKDLNVATSKTKYLMKQKNIKLRSFEVTNTFLDANIIDTFEGSLEFHFKLTRELEQGYSLVQIHDYITQILAIYLDAPNTKLSNTTFVSEAELALLKDFNATDISYESDKTILDLFASSVQNHSAEVAVSYQDTTLSYKDLDIRTGQLANYLVDRFGVKHNDLVGIKLERSTNMLVAILGILKSGGAYVPVDTNYPEERLEYIKSDSGYKVCIDEAFIKAFEIEKDNYSREVIGAKVLGNNLAYAIYTSGSTGNPKGVLNDHNGLYNRLLWMRDDLKITSADVILQKTPYTFDVSVWELLMPSVTGCKLVFAQPDGHKDPAYLLDLIADSQVSILHFVPSMLGIFLEELDPEKCTSLKHVVCSGEALPAVMVEEFKHKLPGVRLHNLYGPTEAAIDVTSIDLTDVNTEESGVTIGKPVANTKIYIVDKNLSLLPVGVPGELLIEGVQVARGYLNRPQLTAEKFIGSPFNEGQRIYRTGDLAKWLPNGEIAYIGRIDNQVKIRGNRIELGEIETRILESGFVENVAVLVKEDQSSRKYLVAYLVPRESYKQEDLYGYLKNRLPEYMLPGLLIEMENLPLTSSGKLNKKVLLELKEEINVSSYEAPRNEMESELAAIWEEVLKLDKVSIHDNFFRIGGDSIVSIRLISKINKAIKTKITIGNLYENNTIAALSNLIAKTEGISNQDDLLSAQIIEKVEKLKYEVLNVREDSDLIEDIYPMHDIQKGMVLLSSINPASGIYHDQFVFQIPKVDLQLLEQALSKLVAKHAILRTCFDLVNYSEEIQIVLKEIDFKITQSDIQTVSSKEQEEFINDFMVSERKVPFDVRTAPLWRIHLFTISPFNEVLLFQFHHSILDGWSIASLYTELFQIYKQVSNDLTYEITYLKTSNKEAVIEELFKKQCQKNIDFWGNEIKSVQNLNIFNTKGTYQQFSISYDRAIKEKLQKKCKEDQITLKTLVYGALVYTIKLLSAENDFMIGLVGNNRPSLEDGDKLLGCFLNTIPVRNRLNDIENLSWKEYFRGIDDKLLSLKSYEDLTFLEINKLANAESGSQSQLINVLFNYVDFHIYEELETNGVDKKEQKVVQNYLNIKSHESTNTYFDIDVNTSGSRFAFNYTLQREFKNELSLERIHKFIDRIILNYIDASENIVGKTALISSEEEHEILAVFNQPSTKYPQRTILELFSESVRNNQSNKAITDSRTTFTYGQLDKEINQFANFLKDKFEISTGDIVGVELNNDSTMIVSFLAILKTGGVYLPIDIDYSASRKELIYADSNCKVVIQDQILQNFRDSKENYKDEFEANVDPNDTAYIIYTSGSTGKPKGVPILHQSLVDYVLTFKNYFNINADDCIVQQSSTSFDTSIEEIFPILISGGSLVMNESKKDLNHLLDLCEKHNVTVLSVNPFIIQYINEVYDHHNFKFRALISGGDVLKPKYIDRIWDKIKIYNTYGPTETTVCATYHEIKDLNSFISIGKPINNRQIYIFSPKSNNLTPIGLLGEICIGGEGVSLGYLNEADLTSRKFIDNPYNAETKLYRTGDLGRWLPDGSIEFLGRGDSQVKIRGFRIELEEIELAILNSGYVKDAAALTIGDEENKRIVAFVVPLEGYSKESTMDYLSAHLPEYMLPSLIVSKETLPLTINGKLDKDALKLPDMDNLFADNYEAPGNDVEKKLVDIWKNLLQVNKIGINDSFFEIGGNSIMVVKLQNHLQKEFQTLINIVELFNNVTIKKQAFILQKELKTDQEEEVIKTMSF